MFVIAGLTVIALSNTANEQAIARNDQDQLLAAKAAEYAVATAKELLFVNWAINTPECTTGPCSCIGTPCVWAQVTPAFQGIDFTAQTASWWTTYGSSTTNKPNVEVGSAPSYIVIDLGCDAVASVNRFRIIGRGTGSTSTTVAFSDVLFEMPLDSQNISTTCGAQLVSASVDNVQVATFTISPSTTASSNASNNPSYFFRTTTTNTCPQTGSTYATCEMNCAGQVRVMGWTYDNGCVNIYGPWANYGSSSQITVTSSGVTHTLKCAGIAQLAPCS